MKSDEFNQQHPCFIKDRGDESDSVGIRKSFQGSNGNYSHELKLVPDWDYVNSKVMPLAIEGHYFFGAIGVLEVSDVFVVFPLGYIASLVVWNFGLVAFDFVALHNHKGFNELR